MISQTSEYALSAVVHLASRAGDTPSSAQEISGSIKVPVGYLQKILRMLARADILSAQRGSGGGFALAKLPSAISVLDVLRASDTQITRIEHCPLGIKGHTKLCSLHRLLDEQVAHMERTFASTSVADLLSSQGNNQPLCDKSGMTPLSLGGVSRKKSPGRPTRSKAKRAGKNHKEE